MKSIAILLYCFLLAQAKLIPQQLRVSTRGGIETSNLVVGQGSKDEIDISEDQDIFEINKDKNYRDGDIVSSNTRSSLVNETRHWPTTVIPVVYVAGLNLKAIATIEEARREFEMRTCFRLVDRTDEPDYILFEALGGCFSSVGIVGGSQTISIGSGCERMSVVVHEIMHAIGIFHEQSRTDRDDYVRIATENIDEDRVYNFNTYDLAYIDNRRVSYDYNSVMHYGDYSFSINDLPTIVTHDPSFQDVIGQRRTFSEGDVTKINRMYKCSDTIRRSYTCDFENPDACGYVEERDQPGWFRYAIGKVPHVSKSANAPVSDGTVGEAGEGSYMLFNSAYLNAGEVAIMKSMRFMSVVPHQCLEFSYYMDLVAGSDASINVHIATIDNLSGVIDDLGSPVTTLSGDHQSDWNTERLTIVAPAEYRLVFKATSGGHSGDAIAIDDVNVIDKPCETNYFVIKNYAEIINSASQGDYIYSPVFSTEDGYAMQLKLYPVGREGADAGYMSISVLMVKGVNDDKLKWPFYNRLVKMSVVDQQSKTLTRMNQFSNLLTEEGGPWEKPTTSRNSAIGYYNFMRMSDITNTRNFVKHNSLMISVDVTDMSPWANSKSNGHNQLRRPPKAMHMDQTKHDDINISVEIQQPDREEKSSDYLTESTAVVIAVSCGAIVFVLMVFLLFAFSHLHLNQMKRFIDTLRKQDNSDELPDYNSVRYSQKSGEVNISMTT